MAPRQGTERLGLLDRLDLELASRVAFELGGLDAESLLARLPRAWIVTQDAREAWIRGILELRGIRIAPDVVAGILRGRRIQQCGRQERVLVAGLDRVLDRLLARGRTGDLPDGWFVVALFESLTQGLPRFANNQLRRDLPWDAQRHVPYPAPDTLGALLDSLTARNCFREVPLVWEATHPVRRAFRAAWRFGRIAPLPDFNLMFAFVLMNAFHLASGYPLLVPQPADKPLLENLVKGGAPRRIVQFERRLLDAAAR